MLGVLAVGFQTFICMNTSFLDYYKMILEKVSFDHALFLKEYSKAVRNLQPAETASLNAWLRSKGLIYLHSEDTSTTLRQPHTSKGFRAGA